MTMYPARQYRRPRPGAADESTKEKRIMTAYPPRGITPEKGRVYRITSRNIPYGAYAGDGEFTGIREKFGTLFLSAEAANAVLEDLGPVPDGIELTEGNWVNNPPPIDRSQVFRQNDLLYAFLADIEKSRPRVDGYGCRPGDPDDKEDTRP